MYNHYLRGLIVNEAKMTQADFARRLGISSSKLCHILYGRSYFYTQEHLQKIADYFNKPVTTIFKGGDHGRTREK